MTDLALPHPVAEVRADTADEFASFYAAFAPRVRALAIRRLANRDLADDVVQETLMRCYRARHRFDAGRPVWPWVRTIATNVCIDLQREGASWREVPTGLDMSDGQSSAVSAASVAAAAANDSADPAHAFLSHQRRECIREALDALTPRQRRVVLLREVEGWRADDVASMEGSSTEAVKGALKRGRQVFRLAYTAAAGSRGLLAPLFVVGGATVAALRRLAVRSSVKTQLVSMTSAAVVTGVAAVAVVGVSGGWAGADSVPVAMPAATSAAVVTPVADVVAHGVSTPSAEARTAVAVAPSAAASAAEVAPAAPDEIRQSVSAPVPGDSSIHVAEVFFTTHCGESAVRRSICDASAAVVVTVDDSGTTPAPLP